MIDLTNREASALADAEKRRLVYLRLHKLDRDIKRLDYTSYVIIILAFLTHDVVIIVFAGIIAYLLSEKALTLETKRLKLRKQFKHLL